MNFTRLERCFLKIKSLEQCETAGGFSKKERKGLNCQRNKGAGASLLKLHVVQSLLNEKTLLPGKERLERVPCICQRKLSFSPAIYFSVYPSETVSALSMK